jgi:hypothetical protein
MNAHRLKSALSCERTNTVKGGDQVHVAVAVKVVVKVKVKVKVDGNESRDTP